VHVRGQLWPSIAGQRPVGEPRTLSSVSLRGFETVLLAMLVNAMACTRSSTRRVDTPPIQAFRP